jgi:AcrR family transcriptional regulator
MARRSDHSRDELKDLILRVAAAIVAADGAAALTARRLADRIGYAPGTIYNLFSSMDELALHLNALTLADLRASLAAAVDPRRGTVDNLKALARAYRAYAREKNALWLMLFTHPATAQAPPPWYLDAAGSVFAMLEELLRPLYSPDDGDEARLAARALWASVHGMVFLEETGRIPVLAAQNRGPDMAAYLIENFIKGIEASR